MMQHEGGCGTRYVTKKKKVITTRVGAVVAADTPQPFFSVQIRTSARPLLMADETVMGKVESLLLA